MRPFLSEPRNITPALYNASHSFYKKLFYVDHVLPCVCCICELVSKKDCCFLKIIFLTLGQTRISLKSDQAQSFVNEFPRVCIIISWTTRVNSDVGNVHVMPLGKYTFSKNRCSESRTSVKGVNSAQEMSTEIVRLWAFVYTVTRIATLYSRTYMDLSVPSTLKVRRGWNSV
jgi:hypothetical protein